MAAPWVDIARRKQEEQKARIPKEWAIDAARWAEETSVSVEQALAESGKEILSKKEFEITGENDAVDIVRKIREGKLSAEEVMVAFCKRAAVVHQLTNCLTEIFFENAIQRAKALDEERKEHPQKPLGPFHGLPISMKDTYHIPGIDATIGLACFAFDPSTSYSPLAEILVSLAAVLFCKTNIPQTLMTADSQNNLFGRTTNPKNRALTAGGSTGGEGPLIALRGSVLGFATDIAGSIRIPSLCNGIYGFKPSSCIIPFSCQRLPFVPGWEGIGIVASAGPMASSARACNFAMEELLKAMPSNLDPTCLRILWVKDRDKRLEDPKQLRIGVIADDGLFTPTPPVRRGLNESVEKLKRAGVTIVPITIPSMLDALPVISGMLGTDGSKYLMDLIQSTGEPIIPSVTKLNLLATGPPMPMLKYYSLNAQRQKIAKAYNEIWSNNKLDAFIMPPAPYTAVPHDEWATASYTVLWNLLDYPAFLLPVGEVNEGDAVDDISMAKYGKADQKVYKLYTGPKDYVKAPIAVQIIGQKQNDQALMVVAGVVDSILSSE